MDIGDPSEIPTTRKKLPSMQELGAFELEPSNAAAAAEPPAPIARQAPATVIDKPDPAPPRPTSQQLRTALARADPATRSKLLRLIAGGRTVEQLARPPASVTGHTHGLEMNLHRAQPQSGQSAQDDERRAARPIYRAASASTPRSGETLLKIDATTDLLDAVGPPPSAEQRSAALHEHLAATLAQESPAGPTAAAHKVLFPAYDPQEHGDDVRRLVRRSGAPVEGHFPAPRQPCQARYRHADGRPMDEDETRVEAVLQEQRCEQTLEVLARDGVNGLLLSPRDLDAAVENGTLDEATATLLWKTWSALRPVIHVIDDETTPREGEIVAPQSEIERDEAPAESIEATDLADLEAALTEEPSDAASAPGLTESGLSPSPEPLVSAAPAPAEVPTAPNAATTIDQPAAITIALVALDEPPDVALRGAPEKRACPEGESAPMAPAPAANRKRRSAALMRSAARIVAAVSVLHSGVTIGGWAWLHWGHWLTG